MDNIGDVEDALAWFRLFFTDELMNILVRETNRYSDQYFANNVLSPQSRARRWRHVTVEDMEVFLGLTILTGIVNKKGHISSYWSKDKVIATPFFNEAMARNRYQLINRFFHCADNDARPPDAPDKLYKIRPVYNYLIDRFRTMYIPMEHISIDEGMLKWRGRLSFRTYNKDKPIKYGIKAYVLADSGNAYCWNMDIYHSQGHTLRQTVLGLLTPVCMGKWYSLYMDNLYNSVELSEELLEEKVYTVGTLRGNRGEPEIIRRSGQPGGPRMEVGEVVSRDNGQVMVLTWKDKKAVKCISTKHDASMQQIARRRKHGHGAMERVMKPVPICDYNEHMAGVDLVDQMISYYPCTRKSLKWTKKVIFWLLELSIHNAHVLYQIKSHRKNISLYDFQLAIVRGLCRVDVDPQYDTSDDDDFDRPVGRVPVHDPRTRLIGGYKKHHADQYPPTDKKRYPTRWCRVCLRNGSQSETRFYCKDCQVPLHQGKCFEDYHSKNNYA
jgi:hypothetical protein